MAAARKKRAVAGRKARMLAVRKARTVAVRKARTVAVRKARAAAKRKAREATVGWVRVAVVGEARKSSNFLKGRKKMTSDSKTPKRVGSHSQSSTAAGSGTPALPIQPRRFF